MFNRKTQKNFINSFSWMRRIEGWAMFAFACGVNVLFGEGEQRFLGFVMIAAFLLCNLPRLNSTLKNMFPLPPEIILYTFWFLWVAITGPLVAQDLELFWVGIRVLIQIVVVVWFTYAILSKLGDSDVIFMAIIVGGLIQIGFVFGGVDNYQSIMDPDQRTQGLMSNPNALGFLMIWSVFCGMMFWHSAIKNKWIFRIFILGFIPVATYVMFASGSRKSALAMGLLIYLWVVFGLKTARATKNWVSTLIIGGLLCWAFIALTPDLVEKTPVGRRFERFLDKGGGQVTQAIEQESRYDMYVDGLKIFWVNPFFGVGLNNFQVYFYTKQYSHSNLIEPLATTGLVGFFLFQTFYIFPILRIWKLLKVVQNPILRYRLKVYLLGMITIVFVGLGAPFYTSSAVYLMLTAITFSSYQIQRQFAQARPFVMQTSSVAGIPR